MNTIKDSLNALTYNNGSLIVNTLHPPLVVDPITLKVLQLVLVPWNIPSAMDVQTHLPIHRLSCLHGRSILGTNLHHPTHYISHIQEILLISTSRVSIPLLNQDQPHNWHNR